MQTNTQLAGLFSHKGETEMEKKVNKGHKFKAQTNCKPENVDVA